MFGAGLLSRLLGRGGGNAVNSRYGAEIASGLSRQYGDDVARQLPASLDTEVSTSALAGLIGGKPSREVANIPSLQQYQRNNSIGDKLIEASNYGLNAPLKLTRKDMREIGPNAKEKIGMLFDRTGISDIDELNKLGKTLTGGENSYLDTVTDYMRTNAGRGNMVDLNDLMGDIRLIKEGTPNKLLQKGLDTKDPIELAKYIRKLANDERTRATRGAGSQELSKMYERIGREIDSRIDANIDPDIIQQGFRDAIEMLRDGARNAIGQGKGNFGIAYKRLADELESIPEAERTVDKFRSFKKDFVDISNIAKRNDMAEGGGAWGRSAKQLPIIGPMVEATIAPGMDKASQKFGEVLRKTGQKFNTGEAQDALKKAGMVGLGGIGALNLLGAGGGRGQDGVLPPDIDPTVGGDIVDPAMAGAMGAGAMGRSISDIAGSGAGAGMNAMGNVMPDTGVTVAGYNRDQLERAYLAALMDDNLKAAEAIGTMLAMLDDKEAQVASLAKEQSKAGANDGKIDSALNVVNSLEGLYRKFGGSQGIIGGNITNALNSVSGGAFNSEVAAYNDAIQGSLAPIIKAMGDSGTLSDSDMKRAQSFIPAITDDPKKAEVKFRMLKELLNQARQGA